MTTEPLAPADALVLDYLATLWAATDDIEPELRDELMTTVADYIAMRRPVPGEPGADPTPLLRRLGPPEALAAAVRRGRIPLHLRRPAALAVPVAAPRTGGSGPEIAALALLTAGSVVLPGAGPLAGLVLASASPRWAPAQKVAAWVLAAGPMLLSAAVLAGAMVMGGGFAVMTLGYAATVVGAFLAALTLLPGLTSRRAAYPG
ncbi:hypothetical protein [Actinoplanes sp. N902-109]|uniref:hypothetical protein n=1 Tax=Actinoplanes sp. (strain N902-109) TaxID=649831 RepID=UPI0003A9D4C2|nr:hypothetical protein [Actinoplanes sp. N902-109]